MRTVWNVYVVVVVSLICAIPRPVAAQERSLDQGLNEIAKQITESIPAGKTTTLAVMDFNDLQGNVTMLGRFVGEELITRLFQTKRFKVIERSLLEKAIEELKFNTSDLVDPSVAKQLGKAVGAEAIVTGTLTDLGKMVKVNARVITVESGEVVGAAGAQIGNDASIKDMLSKPIGTSSVIKPNSSGNGAGDKQPAEPNTQQVSPKIIQKENGFIFAINNCDAMGQTVTCDLSVTNTDPDRTVLFGGSPGHGAEGSRMIDDSGSQYSAVHYKLANNSSGPRSSDVSSLLVSGVPVKLSMEFQGVSPQAKSVALLSIGYAVTRGSYASTRNYRIQFRNIQLER